MLQMVDEQFAITTSRNNEHRLRLVVVQGRVVSLSRGTVVDPVGHMLLRIRVFIDDEAVTLWSWARVRHGVSMR